MAAIFYGIFEVLWSLWQFFGTIRANWTELFKQAFQYFTVHLYKVERFRPKDYSRDQLEKRMRKVMMDELTLGYNDDDMLADRILMESRLNRDED